VSTRITIVAAYCHKVRKSSNGGFIRIYTFFIRTIYKNTRLIFA